MRYKKEKKLIVFSKRIWVKVIKDNPRYAGYFPFVVRMKRDGLDKEKLYKTLDESLLSILKKEAEVYKK